MNPDDRQAKTIFKPHYKTIRSIAFDSQHHKIATGSDDTTISLTDIETAKKEHIF